jgi:hypothetical protein
MIKAPGPLAVVCHDAGATNLILSWLMSDFGLEVRAFMRGPAADLWRVAFPNAPLCNTLEEALKGAQTLLSGTGWASLLEHEARQKANANGIFSVAVLDHWINYSERFELDGLVQLPNEIWVADRYALELAQKAFPSLLIRQMDNLYLKTQVAKVGEPPGNGTVLVLMEPVRNSWGREREGEFQALDYLFENVKRLWPLGVTKVLLRPHPSELASKYQAWLNRHSQVCLDSSIDVAAAISRADFVVGVESFALTIALEAGRPVYSSLPPWAPDLRLPHAGIQQIRYLSKL